MPREASGVRFLDLRRSIARDREALDVAIAEVLDSGRFVLRSQVEDFEREFAPVAGTAHAVGVASGTDAVELALRALGVGAGDEVVTQANTCVPTVAAIARAGAQPVLCDVDPAAATIDLESLERAIGPRTRAIVPVHLYGQMADMPAICELATARGIAVVEDCAQAHGAALGGAPAGSFGHAGAFSFYPTKNLGAFGDGGAVTTDDPEFAGRLTSLRAYGAPEHEGRLLHGVNSRLDELQAALLRVRLRRLAEGNAARRDIAARYAHALEGAAAAPLALLPDREHAFHLFVIRTPARDRLRAELGDAGVDTLVHYPEPVHRLPGYESLAQGPVPLAESERLAGEILSLPLYPELTEDEVEFVARATVRASGS